MDKVKELDGAMKQFENAKVKEVEKGNYDSHSDSEDENLYLTPNGKFDVLNEFFGISALPLPQCGGNERRMKKAIKHLKKIGALISGDYERLWHVITALKGNMQHENNNKRNRL